MYLSYRLPAKFMFENLNMVWLYPVYNAILSCLGVVIVSGIKNNNVSHLKVAMVGVCGLTVGIFLLYIRCNSDTLMYAFEHVAVLLPFIIATLSDVPSILFYDGAGPSNRPVADSSRGAGPSSGAGPSTGPAPVSEENPSSEDSTGEEVSA